MYLKTYYQYVNHYQYVVQWLAKRKGDKVLQKILDGLKPEATGKGIKDFMIMPIQRIPRYKLFLVELIKCTWKSHIDYDNLVEANKKVQDVAVAIENQSADALSIAKVMELAGSFKSKGESFKLVVPHRRYIADTDATLLPDNITQTSAMVFLFSYFLSPLPYLLSLFPPSTFLLFPLSPFLFPLSTPLLSLCAFFRFPLLFFLSYVLPPSLYFPYPTPPSPLSYTFSSPFPLTLSLFLSLLFIVHFPFIPLFLFQSFCSSHRLQLCLSLPRSLLLFYQFSVVIDEYFFFIKLKDAEGIFIQ